MSNINLTSAQNDLILAYTSFYEHIEAERDHLIEKLIEVKAITYDDQTNKYSLKKYNSNTKEYEYINYNGKPSFTTLLEEVDPKIIDSSISGKATSVKPILKGGLYNSTSNSFIYPKKDKIPLEEVNLFLINKTNLYRDYLSYQLEDMGIDKQNINSAITLYDKIELISEIERVQDITIELFIEEENIGKDILIYKDIINVLNVTFKDEKRHDIEKGSVKVFEYFDGYENTDLSEKDDWIFYGRVIDDVTVVPHKIGETKYIIYYINKDKNSGTLYPEYRENVEVVTVKTVLSNLVPYISIKNDTNLSKFYMDTYSFTYGEGYKTDLWDIDIEIKAQRLNQGKMEEYNVGTSIPFNLYINDEDTLIYSGETDNNGHKSIDNLNIPYFSSDFISFKENAITLFTTRDIEEETNSPAEVIMNAPLNPPWSATLINNCKLYIGLKNDYIIFDNSDGSIKAYTTQAYKIEKENGELDTEYRNELIFEGSFDRNTQIICEENTFTDNNEEYKYTIFKILKSNTLTTINIQRDINPALDPTIIWKINGQANIKTIDLNVSFITNPTFKNGKIQYERIECTPDTFLDELNGCITNVSVNNNQLTYETFSTNQHIKLSNITNFHELYSLVTEIVYTVDEGRITFLDYETLSSQKYEYVSKNKEENISLILKTQMSEALLNRYPNTDTKIHINLYHLPVEISTPLIWYKNDLNAPDHIIFSLKDEKTGDINNVVSDVYTLEINGTEYNMNDITYQYPLNIFDLSYDGTDITYSLKKKDDILYTCSEHIQILSNFELPTETTFYSNIPPQFFYKPRGTAYNGATVKIYETINNNSRTLNTTTNNQGFINYTKNDIGDHYVKLTATSNNISESVEFSYTIVPPLNVTLIEYFPETRIKYKISAENIDNVSIIAKNKDNDDIPLSIEKINGEIIVTILKTEDNIGTNTLTVTLDNYTKTENFDFYDRDTFVVFATAENVVRYDTKNIILSGVVGNHNNNFLPEKKVEIYQVEPSNTYIDETFTDNSGQFYYLLPINSSMIGVRKYKAIFPGDEQYNQSTSNIVTITVRKLTSSITMDIVNEAMYGQSKGILGSVSIEKGVANGQKVYIYVDGVKKKEVQINDSDYSSTLHFDKIGQTNIMAQYIGSETIDEAIITKTVTVNKATTTINSNADNWNNISVGEKLLIDVSSINESFSANSVIMNLNGNNIALTEKNSAGKFEYNIPTSIPNNSPLTITYPGDSNHQSSSISLTVCSVGKILTNMTQSENSVLIEFLVLTENNKPIPNIMIQVSTKVNQAEVIMEPTTNSAGIAYAEFSKSVAPVGTYVIYAKYNDITSESVSFTITR